MSYKILAASRRLASLKFNFIVVIEVGIKGRFKVLTLLQEVGPEAAKLVKCDGTYCDKELNAAIIFW